MADERRIYTADMGCNDRHDLLDLYRRISSGVLFTVVHGDGSHGMNARVLASAGGERAGTFPATLPGAHLLDDAPSGRLPQMYLAAGGVLAEDTATDEAAALFQAMEAAVNGETRTVVTVLPEGAQGLQRFVMDAAGDVLFASDSLETEDLVPLRRIALRSAHGVTYPVSQVRIFVEVLEPEMAVCA